MTKPVAARDRDRDIAREEIITQRWCRHKRGAAGASCAV